MTLEPSYPYLLRWPFEIAPLMTLLVIGLLLLLPLLLPCRYGSITAAMSYAVGCGLHQIGLRSTSPSSPVLSSPPGPAITAVTSTLVGGSFASRFEDNGSNSNTNASDNFNVHDDDNNNTGLRFFPPPRDEHETIQRIRLWHAISIVSVVTSCFLRQFSPFNLSIFSCCPPSTPWRPSFHVVCCSGSGRPFL